MTSETAIDSPAPIARVGLETTFQHIELLHRKREQLLTAQVAAEEQFLHQLGFAYRDGRISETELVAAYREWVELAAPGLAARWESGTGTHAGRMQQLARSRNHYEPNMPDGTWRGSSPLAEGDHIPGRGRCVVYVLYDAANQPCYVGSTKHMLVRLQGHRNSKKEFTWWTAFPCADREAAYQLEERLLAEHKPYLNKKRGR